MGRIVKRCRKYERRFPRLQQLSKTHDWKCSFAKSIGVRGKEDLNREWRLTQTAGLIMLLAATGMRASEIMSVERDGLASVRTGATTLWYVSGIVFKFHYGEKTRWLCGTLGRRAHALLSKLTSERKLASNSKGGQIGGHLLNRNLNEWMAMQGWRDAEGNPLHIHSHQFRRTFARLVMRHPGMNLLALKDHFKHKSVKMTDYYVGCDDELRAMILDGHPGAQMDAFDAEMRKAAGLEDAG
jgi:integrase